MLTINLYGVLRKEFGPTYCLNVRSPREAVNALDRLRPGFKAAIMRVKGSFRLRDGKRTLREEHLEFPAKTLSITPLYGGASSKALGIGEAILGVVLVVVGVVLAATGFGAAFAPFLIGAGLSLTLGGISALLAGHPNLSTNPDSKRKPSYQFNGPINTTAQGEARPVCLGRMICGTAVVSEGIISDNVRDATTANTTGPGGYSHVGTSKPANPIFANEP